MYLNSALVFYLSSYLLYSIFPFSLTPDNFSSLAPVTPPPSPHLTHSKAHQGELEESALQLFLSTRSYNKPGVKNVDKRTHPPIHHALTGAGSHARRGRGITLNPAWHTHTLMSHTTGRMCVTTQMSRQEKPPVKIRWNMDSNSVLTLPYLDKQEISFCGSRNVNWSQADL